MAAGEQLRVTDPHLHFWDLSTGLYPRRSARGAGKTALTGDWLPADLRLAAGRVVVERAVHVEAFPLDGLAEARVQSALARAEGQPKAIVAYCDLSRPDINCALADLAAIPEVRGIRQVLDRWVDRPGQVQRNLLGDPAWHRGFSCLSAHGLSFDLQIAPEQIDAAARLAIDHPEVPIVLNHLGRARGQSHDEWRRKIACLAGCENMRIKLSGFGMFESAPSAESIRPFIDTALDLFGSERAMLASNFPIDGQGTAYDELWQHFADATAHLSRSDRARLFGGTADSFYRLG
ncbi:amidohydrolase family protein [Frigidibacter sp. ROC022]|uniref:amidohydrolase family protein n=1 Tax=Frigidibacter sp. ROC022 TaxID=2971796 RepID=UPI00215B550E|nr:amidohydrolase family protein [Frigidibacter sp. ROC022]MCR8724671.1 amidohydrolase family protein [Frigidibacter sp. ROC022]